jgi:hypothetical protein
MYRRECDCSWTGLFSVFRIDNMRKLHTQALYVHTVHGSAKFANNVTFSWLSNQKARLNGRASVYLSGTIERPLLSFPTLCAMLISQITTSLAKWLRVQP